MIKHMRSEISTSIITAAVTAASLVVTAAAWGQSPPDAGKLLEQTQKSAPPPAAAKPKVDLPVPTELPPPGRNESKIFVKGFTFTLDLPVAGSPELAKVVEGYTNREVTFGELEQAADLVARYLREKGYFLAKAYLPEQSVAQGVVQITILVGRIEGGSKVEGNPKRLKESVVQKILNRAIPSGSAARLGDMERGVLLVNDLPGVAAALSLSAGSEPGTTRVTVKTSQGPLITGSATVDNFGNRYTGAERVVGTVNVNNPTGYGDLLTLSGVAGGEPLFDTNGGKMYMWRAGWLAPVGYSGLKVGASYSSLGYRIGEELAETDGTGKAKTWGANASYPLLRARERNLYGTLSYEYRDLFNSVAGATTSDKRVHSVTAGVQGDLTDKVWNGGYSGYGVSLTGGDLDLGNCPDDLALDQQTRRANGSYWKVGYNASRQQNIGAGFALYGALYGQFAAGALDSSEQISLGGSSGVRAYPSGEGTGDQGAIFNLELRKDFSFELPIGHLQASAFYDYGWVQLHKDTWENWNQGNPALKNSYGLKGAGLGLNISKTTPYLQYMVRTFWSAAIGGNPGESEAGHDSDGRNLEHRFWLQGAVYF